MKEKPLGEWEIIRSWSRPEPRYHQTPSIVKRDRSCDPASPMTADTWPWQPIRQSAQSSGNPVTHAPEMYKLCKSPGRQPATLWAQSSSSRLFRSPPNGCTWPSSRQSHGTWHRLPNNQEPRWEGGGSGVTWGKITKIIVIYICSLLSNVIGDS